MGCLLIIYQTAIIEVVSLRPWSLQPTIEQLLNADCPEVYYKLTIVSAQAKLHVLMHRKSG